MNRSKRLVACSPAMASALELCGLYARFHRPVVLIGPVGVGKTALAEELHRLAPVTGDFVAVSSGDLGGALYEDVLFGHVPGAFTGASSRRRGAFAKAAHGVLLLDDLALMPIGTQAAILRVIESGKYSPLGSSRDRRATCRIVFASTEEPRALVASEHLLVDLQGRLGELIIRVPPLAARRDDIVPIALEGAQALLDDHNLDARAELNDDARELLMSYPWPGNVRELRAVMERAAIHAGVKDGVASIRAAHLPAHLREMDTEGTARPTLTRELVASTLRYVNGNKSAAARALGVHRNTIGRYAPPQIGLGNA